MKRIVYLLLTIISLFSLNNIIFAEDSLKNNVIYAQNQKATPKNTILNKDSQGVERLAYVIRNNYSDMTLCMNTTKITDFTYELELTRCRNNWANTKWIVNIFPNEDQYKIAPKGGYWYSLRDNGKIIGICQAYRK